MAVRPELWWRICCRVDADGVLIDERSVLGELYQRHVNQDAHEPSASAD